MDRVLAEREYPTVSRSRPSLERRARKLDDGSPVRLAPKTVTITVKLNAREMSVQIVKLLEQQRASIEEIRTKMLGWTR